MARLRLYQTALAWMLAACSSPSGTGPATGNAGASGGDRTAGADSAGANSLGGSGANGGATSSGSGALAGDGGNSGAPTMASGGALGGNSGAPTMASGGALGGNSGAPTMANGGALASGGASGGTGPAVGTIVPLYTDPGDPSWTAIVAAKKAHPAVAVVAIVNPDSGPGAKVDSSYASGITRLISAGITAIGYVSTSYTARGEPAVKTDIDRWHTFYPNLQGVFFDEQSDKPGDDTFYRDVSSYAKALGLALTVGNPGTNVPASYSGAVDVMLIYESKGLPKLDTIAGHAPARAQYGIIPYGTALDPAFVAAALAQVQYIYATSDDLPNPWDTLTPYFGDLLTALRP